MASPTTPILGLTLMTTSQAQKEVVFNQLAIAFDALFKGSVLDSQLTAPPGTPSMGDAYIIPASASGAWSGKDHHVTFYYNGWQFVAPSLKLRLYSVAQSEYLVYQSDGTWTAEPSSTVSVLNDLTNVSGSAANGQVLQFSTTDNKWHPWTIAFPALALSALSDVTVTEGAPIDGYALTWTSADSKWEAKPVLHTNPHFAALPDVNLTGAQQGYLAAYTADPVGIHFVDPTNIVTVSSLGQVGDVAYPVGGISHIPNGAALVWNGAAWAPAGEGGTTVAVTGISDGPGSMDGHAGMAITVNSVESAWQYTPFALNSLIDVTVTEGAPIDGHVLAWNQGAQRWEPVAHSTNALNNMTDVNVPSETSAIDGYALVWHNADNAWEARQLSPVAFSGAFADLASKPSLAPVATSGAYADLTGKPALATVAISGNYSDLSGLPVIPVTLSMLNDVRVTEGAGINGKALVWNQADTQWEPGTIAVTLAALTDVLVTSPSNGQTLVWNAGASKWENGTITAGSSALASDTDVTLTSPSDGQVLTYHAATSKWINAAPSGGGGGVGGGSGTLAGDSDVNITSPTDNQILAYNAGAGKWENATFSADDLEVVVPAVVQYATSTAAYAATSTATFATAPTPGHLLVLMCVGFGPQTLTPPAGFTLLFQDSPAGNQQVAAFVKPCITGDGTSYAVTSGHDYNVVVAYEISGVSSSAQLTYSFGVPTVVGDVLSASVWNAANQISIIAFEHDTANALTINTGQSAVIATPICSFPGNHVSTQAVIGASEYVAISATCTTTPTNPIYGILTLTGSAALSSGTLSGDSDVLITSPTNGQVLTWNATAGKWENTSGGGAVAIQDNGAAVTTAATTLNFVGASSITNSSGDVTITYSGGGGSGVASWTTLSFNSTISGFGPGGAAETYHKSDQSFTIAAGDTIEIEGYVHRSSGNNAEILMSQDGAFAFAIASQSDGNVVLYQYNTSSHAINASGTGDNNLQAAGTYHLSLKGFVVDASKNITLWGESNAYRTGDIQANGVVDLTGSTLHIYVTSDDMTKTNVRARVVNAASIANVFTDVGASAGTVGVVPPTLVQTAVNSGATSTVTLGAAPTAGNLLICLLTHWSNGVTFPAGWNQSLYTAGGTDDGLLIGWRPVASGDGTTISVLSNANGMSAALFEVANANAVLPIGNIGYFQDLTQTVGTVAATAIGDRNLVVGMFSTDLSTNTPTIVGPTGTVLGTTGTSTGGSGGPRSVSPFSAPLDKGTATFTGTWTSSVNTYGIALVVQPGFVAPAISNMNDVAETTLSNKQQLLYDSTASKWKNENSRYDLAISISGTMANNEVLLQYVAPVAFKIASGAAGCYAVANTAAAASTTVTLKKNGTSVGTLVWASSGTSATITISADIVMAAGDVLQLFAPATADTALADVGVTLAGVRI